MTRIFCFITIMLVITSCYNEQKLEAIPPDPFIVEEQLVEILTDMQLAEGIISFDRLNKATNKGDFKDSVYSVVLKNYGLTAKELTDNLAYYNQDPKNMEKLYEKVLSNLSTLQSEIKAEAAASDTLSKENED